MTASFPGEDVVGDDRPAEGIPEVGQLLLGTGSTISSVTLTSKKARIADSTAMKAIR
jgi:hypothetical protein